MAATPDLTFDDAAERLGLTTEEFKRRLKLDPAFKRLDVSKKRDGTSFRFPSGLIDELARELGEGSNPDNPLPSGDESPLESSEFTIPASAGAGDDPPLDFGSDDVFSLATDDPPAPRKPDTKKTPKSGSDSDVRLDGGKTSGKLTGKSGAESVPTEEIAIDLAGPGSAVIRGGSSAKLSAPKSSGKLTSESGKSLAKPGTGDSSEFELSLDADSDDFELKLNTDDSDSVDLGEMPKEAPGGSSARRGGESGILSRKPNDSGVSLEKGKGKDKPPLSAKDESDDDVDFELTLDSSAAVSSTKLGGLKKPLAADSDSEFELTLDDSSGSGELEAAALGDAVEASKGDIFETDFEIPPMEESSSEAVALESSDTDLESSDVDVALEDSDVAEDSESSGSEVVLLEEDEEAPASARAKKGKAKARKVEEDDAGDVDLAEVEEDEEDGSAAKALRGAKGKRRDEDDEEDEEEEKAAAAAGVYRPVPWGIFPALFLVPAFALTLLGGLMGFELVQTMWGYQQPRKPSAPIVRGIAQQLDMELKDQ